MKPEAHVPAAEYAEQHPMLAPPGESKLMQHMPQLDGVRAIAVLMVIWWHFMPSTAKEGSVAPWGAIGVGLFFTLSGFLITRILLNCKLKIESQQATVGKMMKQFYVRRFLRIFPLYYGVLLVLFIINPLNYDANSLPTANQRVMVTNADGTQKLGAVQSSQSIPITVIRNGIQKNTTTEQYQIRLDEGASVTAETKDVAVEYNFRDRVWWHVAYLSNVRFSYWRKAGEIERHLWSLSVEEQFYLIWPILIFLAPRKILGPLILATIVAAPLWRVLTYLPGQLGHEWMMPGCLDLLGMGAFLAYLSLPQFGWSRFWNNLVELAGLIGIPLFLIFVSAKSFGVLGARGELETISWFGFQHTASTGKTGWLSLGFDWPEVGGLTYPIVALFSFWLIAMASRGFRGPIGFVLSSTPLVYVGRISYGLYVLHMFVPHLVDYFFPSWGWGETRGWTQFFGFTVISIALASLSWYLFEAPLNRLKKYFEYEKKSAA